MSSQASISALHREPALDSLEASSFDCIVIGGGITGAGIACEASRRGLRVALLEADDFAAGTSSRSSKLIHGGLRYLAMGDVALVRETALERKEILRLAPHLAERRWMVLPTRTRSGMLKLRFGVSAYEKLGAVDKADIHRNWSRADLEREEPLLDRERYPHAISYREYLTDDARLVLANLRAAVREGAVVLNHTPVDRILCEGGRAAGIEAVCSLSGRRVRVRAASVLNAAGPWVEAVRRLEDADAQPLLTLSKGIHLVLPRERLPLRNMTALWAGDSRTIFVIPRDDIVYIGTTDTLYPGEAMLWPRILREDVEYLLAPLPGFFSTPPIEAREVIAAWAGLRPLVSDPGKKTTEISRRDEILVGAANVVSIAGGKLTGYRPTARRATEKIAELLGRKLAPSGSQEPLPGGDFDGALEPLEQALIRDSSLSPRAAARLVRLYGSEAGQIAASSSSPLVEDGLVLAGEVDWAVEDEGAVRLEDWVYRRTRAALYQPGERDAILEPGAEGMGKILSWNPERVRDEIAAVRSRLMAELSFGRRTG